MLMWSSLPATDSGFRQDDGRASALLLFFCIFFLAWRDGVFLMVNLWWNAGERWSENDLNSPAENMSHFLDLFFGLSRFGNWINGGGLACPVWWTSFGRGSRSVRRWGSGGCGRG